MGITCGHSPHRERLVAKPSTGGVQGPDLGPLVHWVQGQRPWRGVQGRSPQKLMGSTLKVHENLLRRVKFTRPLLSLSGLSFDHVLTFMLFIILYWILNLYHFHQRFHTSTNFKFPRVAHFSRLSSKLMGSRAKGMVCGKDSLWARCSQGSRAGVVRGQRPLA